MRALAFAIAALFALPAHAESGAFSQGCQAKPWNLVGEEKACFTAKVVDILCELTGDCPDACGNGTRQLGLVRDYDRKLIFPNKNTQPVFSGAATDLAPFCGKRVYVDGLLVGGDEIAAGVPKIYQVQRIREVGGAWQPTNRFTKEWARANPDAKGKGPWFRRDSRVAREIEADGYLGLGHDADEAFIKDWY